MSKKIVLAMILLVVFLFTACASAEEEEWFYDPFEVYQGTVGNIAFAFPGIPLTVFHDADNEGVWTDSLQMWGNCAWDRAEYQLRSADIAPLLEGFKERYPEDSDEHRTYQALYNFATYYISQLGGTTDTPAVDTEKHLMLFNYTYSDTPDSTYRAKCYLDGTYAVCFYMEECDECEKAMSLFEPLTEKKQAMFDSIRFKHLIDFYGLPMVFPQEPVLGKDQGTVSSAFCMAEDYTNILAQYVHVGLTFGGTPEEAEETMKTLSEDAMEMFGPASILSGTLSGDESEWTYDYVFMLDSQYNEILPEAFTWRGKTISGENGIWYLFCNDTETGRAWLNSMIDPSLQLSPDSALWMDENLVLTGEQPADGEPVSLRRFCKNFKALMLTGPEGIDGYSADSVSVGDPVWTNGQWKRVLYLGYSDEFLVLSVSSEEEDALVNEIEIFINDQTDESLYALLTSWCAESAECEPGDYHLLREKKADELISLSMQSKHYTLSGSHVDPDAEIGFNHMSIKALNPAALPVLADTTIGITPADPVKTVRQFRDAWHKLNMTIFHGQFLLEDMDPVALEDGTFMYASLFGNGSVVTLVTKAESIDSDIVYASVHNLDGDTGNVVDGGMLAHAALSGMEPQLAFYDSMILSGHLNWDDLYYMDPAIGYNGKMLAFYVDEYDGEPFPLALVMDMALQEAPAEDAVSASDPV